MAAPLSVDAYVEGVLAGDRAVLARTITLVESRSPRHREALHAGLVTEDRAAGAGAGGVHREHRDAVARRGEVHPELGKVQACHLLIKIFGEPVNANLIPFVPEIYLRQGLVAE